MLSLLLSFLQLTELEVLNMDVITISSPLSE